MLRFTTLLSLVAIAVGCSSPNSAQTDTKSSPRVHKNDSLSISNSVVKQLNNNPNTSPNAQVKRVVPEPSADLRNENEPKLRVTGISLETTPTISGPEIFAEVLKKLRGDKRKGAQEIQEALLGKDNGLTRLFGSPSAISDPFERKRAEEKLRLSVSGIGEKFILKFGKPLSSYKFKYKGPVFFESYDFNKQEIKLTLCTRGQDKYINPEMKKRGYYNGSTYYFSCDGEIFSKEFPSNSVVDAVKDINIQAPISLDAYKQKYLPQLFLSMPYVELYVKASPDVAEKVKKSGRLPSKTMVTTGGSFNANNDISVFVANIDLTLDQTNEHVRQIFSNLTVHGLFAILKPKQICLENILSDEKYLCGVPRGNARLSMHF